MKTISFSLTYIIYLQKRKKQTINKSLFFWEKNQIESGRALGANDPPVNSVSKRSRGD